MVCYFYWVISLNSLIIIHGFTSIPSFYNEYGYGIKKTFDKPINPVKLSIIPTAVLNFAPWLELHHIIAILPNKKDDNLPRGVFALDFTPIDQANPNTILKLLSGKNVPAEVRVRYISSVVPVEVNEKIKDTWSQICTIYNPLQSKEITELTLTDPVEDEDMQYIQKMAERIRKKWSGTYPTMNFYNHNCRNFSKFCADFIKRCEVCELENSAESLIM